MLSPRSEAVIKLPGPDQPFRHARIRHRIGRFLRSVGVDADSGVTNVVGAVQQCVERRIVVYEEPIAVPGFFSTVFVDDEDLFAIMVQQHTSRAHQEHMVLHELAHILTGTVDTADAVVQGTHRSGDYSQQRESDAEYIATLIGVWCDASTTARLIVQPSRQAARLAAAASEQLAW